MTVNIEEYFSGFHSFIKHLFRRHYFWNLTFLGVEELPIQVLPDKRASIIPNYHTIWVEHWDYFKDKCVSQVLSSRVLA